MYTDRTRGTQVVREFTTYYDTFLEPYTRILTERLYTRINKRRRAVNNYIVYLLIS